MRYILTLALCLAASTGFAQNTGINTANPSSTFEVNGSEGVRTKTYLTSGNSVFTPDATASIYVYTVNNGNLIYLPNYGCENRVYTLVNKTSSTITLSTPYYSMTNSAFPFLFAYSSITVVFMDGEWQQIR